MKKMGHAAAAKNQTTPYSAVPPAPPHSAPAPFDPIRQNWLAVKDMGRESASPELEPRNCHFFHPHLYSFFLLDYFFPSLIFRLSSFILHLSSFICRFSRFSRISRFFEIARELLSGGHFPPCLRGGFRCENYLLSENGNSILNF